MSIMSMIKKIFTLAVVLILLIGSVAISSLNAESVELNLYWYQISLPLGFMLMVFSSMGVLFGMLLSWLFWTWPANKRKTYWEREYFKLKRVQDEQNAVIQAASKGEGSSENKSLTEVP